MFVDRLFTPASLSQIPIIFFFGTSTSKFSLSKIENIQEWVLGSVCNDFVSNYKIIEKMRFSKCDTNNITLYGYGGFIDLLKYEPLEFVWNVYFDEMHWETHVVPSHHLNCWRLVVSWTSRKNVIEFQSR